MLVRYENSDAEKFRLSKIINGELDCFLPLNIISEDGEIIGSYSDCGYNKLADIFFDSEKILDFALLFFEMVEKMRDMLFFPDRMVLGSSNIFSNTGVTEIKTIYVRDSRAYGERRKVAGLFRSIKRNCTAECRENIDEIVRAYEKCGGDIYRILAAISEMKRNRKIVENRE